MHRGLKLTTNFGDSYLLSEALCCNKQIYPDIFNDWRDKFLLVEPYSNTMGSFGSLARFRLLFQNPKEHPTFGLMVNHRCSVRKRKRSLAELEKCQWCIPRLPADDCSPFRRKLARRADEELEARPGDESRSEAPFRQVDATVERLVRIASLQMARNLKIGGAEQPSTQVVDQRVSFFKLTYWSSVSLKV